MNVFAPSRSGRAKSHLKLSAPATTTFSCNSLVEAASWRRWAAPLRRPILGNRGPSPPQRRPYPCSSRFRVFFSPTDLSAVAFSSVCYSGAPAASLQPSEALLQELWRPCKSPSHEHRRTCSMALTTLRANKKASSFLTVLGVSSASPALLSVVSILVGALLRRDAYLSDYRIKTLFIFRFDPGSTPGDVVRMTRARKPSRL